eukprot:GHVS01002145.1.p1 GENE.GHVS01002145.1~~GHVS01002145.1.p1  ORF type:complete len:1152 (-),score=194.65 GHVS01002145.1:551-4006(-)
MTMSTSTCQFNSRRCDSTERCRRCSLRTVVAQPVRRSPFNIAEPRFAMNGSRDAPSPSPTSSPSHSATTRSPVYARRSPSPTIPDLMAIASSVTNESTRPSSSHSCNNTDSHLLTYQLQVARSNILTQTIGGYQKLCSQPSRPVHARRTSRSQSKTLPGLKVDQAGRIIDASRVGTYRHSSSASSVHLSSPSILAGFARETSSSSNMALSGHSHASFHLPTGPIFSPIQQPASIWAPSFPLCSPSSGTHHGLQLSQFSHSHAELIETDGAPVEQQHTSDEVEWTKSCDGLDMSSRTFSKEDDYLFPRSDYVSPKAADAAGPRLSLGPVAVRRRSSAQRMERLYSYEELNRKRPCTTVQLESQAAEEKPSAPPSLVPAAFTSSPSSRQAKESESVGSGYCVFNDWPLELMLMLGYYLNGDDLGRMCSLNREWHYICTTLQQPLWQELVLKKYGFKYENYMLYTQLNDWHLMYAKANTFLKRLKNNAPYITPFSGLLRPAIQGYQGSLAMTADSSTLLWENGEYLQAVDVNEGISLYSVRVKGIRDPMTSHPCLVNTQTKVFLHLNKEIRVFCLATGQFLGNLQIPLEPDEAEGHWEPNDFSLDVSIRNQQVTFLAREALFVFDSETLEFVYKVVHKETTAEEGIISKDIDFLWAGYHCSSISSFSSGKSSCAVPRSLSRSNSGGMGCSCGGATSCRRKSRHIITWLRKASKNIKIFDVCSGKQLVQLEGHDSKVLRVRQAQNIYRLEDYFLASLDVSGVVRIWDSANNLFQCIHMLNASSSPLTSAPALNVREYAVQPITGGGSSVDGPEREDGGQEGGSGDECVSTTFRLSFSSTHLMTMSECRGQTVRVHRDGRQGEDEPEEVQKAIVLKIWNFDAGKLSKRSRSSSEETATTAEGRRGLRTGEKEDTISEDEFGSVICPTHQEMFVEGEEVPEEWINQFNQDESVRREDALTETVILSDYQHQLVDTTEASSPRSTASSPFYSVGTANSPRSPSMGGGVLDVYGSYVLPDNAYFADFLDNQLVGVWMSKTTREVDFSSTLSDWSVFNCLQPPAELRQLMPSSAPSPMQPPVRINAGEPRDESRGAGVDLQSLKDSYVFRMQGRGDIWTLLDWKCISINSAGDLVVYDFCPIADAAKKGRHCVGKRQIVQ